MSMCVSTSGGSQQKYLGIQVTDSQTETCERTERDEANIHCTRAWLLLKILEILWIPWCPLRHATGFYKKAIFGDLTSVTQKLL